MIARSSAAVRIVPAACLLLISLAGASEEIRIDTVSLAPGAREANLAVEATARTGPIQGYVLSVRFDPTEAEVTSFSPSGSWLAENPPDFLRAVGTASEPGEPGVAGLAVILDMEPSGPPKAIPARPDGTFETIALLQVSLQPGTLGEIAFRLADNAAMVGSGPPLINSLVIEGRDYAAGSSTAPLILHSGGILVGQPALRGDANGDGSRDISDAIFLLTALFLGGPVPTCLELADANHDGLVDLSDAIFLLDFLFRGGMEPDPAEGCS